MVQALSLSDAELGPLEGEDLGAELLVGSIDFGAADSFAVRTWVEAGELRVERIGPEDFFIGDVGRPPIGPPLDA
jgi:hypothetical protein